MPPDSRDDGPGELERQVERGNLYTHTALGRNAERLAEVESLLYGTIDVLVAKGRISIDEVREAAARVRAESMARGDMPEAGVAVRMAPSAPQPVVPVDCSQRLPICGAVCCKLDFALTLDEVEAGLTKWDLGRPYFIRHGPDGSCVHLDRATKGCGVYDTRPGTCRGYSCAEDRRIWKDFDKMELNDEWLSENLDKGDRLVAVGGLLRFIET
jgi:Fe-S-cluster containining protein